MQGGCDYLLRFQKPSVLIIEEGTSTTDWQGETANLYDYSKTVVGQVGNKKVARITVAARNDAHIGLGENNQHNCKKYEVVIGGWGNGASALRYGNQGPAMGKHQGKVLGGLNEPRTFELDWSDG